MGDPWTTLYVNGSTHGRPTGQHYESMGYLRASTINPWETHGPAMGQHSKQ